MDKKPGVSLRLNKSESARPSNVAAVFDESDDEAESSTADRFDSKYGGLKAREQRAVQQVLEDDPNAYAYDEVYDSIAQKRKAGSGSEEKKEVERSAKYIGKFMEAKKKRDLEKLLRDERKQEKERVTEGDEFEDKEVFITSAYRKQLEETVKFRQELEAADKVDELTSVQKQKMWQEDFNKRLLEDRVQERFSGVKVEDQAEIKTEPVDEERKPQVQKSQVQIKKEPEPTKKRNIYFSESESEPEPEPDPTIIKRRPGLNTVRRRKQSTSPSPSPPPRREAKRSDRRERKDERRERRDARSDQRNGGSRRRYEDGPRRGSPAASRRRRPPSPEKPAEAPKPPVEPKRPPKSIWEAEREERARRMAKVRELLRQRNSASDVEAARRRYFERRQQGVIVPTN